MKSARVLWLIAVISAAHAAHGQPSQPKAPLLPSHAPAAATAAVRPGAGAAVARVNGVALSDRDLQREMQRIFPYAGVHGSRIPGGYPAEVRQQALDQIVFEELLHQEARRRKMIVPSTMFRDVTQQAQSRFPSRAEYEAYATQEYGGVQAFENQLRRGILIAMLTDQEITKKAAVTDAQVRELYDRNKSRFMKPASIWVQSISIRVKEGATPAQRAEARRRAEQILPQAKEARTYEQFGQLAEKFSEDDWRVMMGDHRWIHRGRMPEAVEKLAFTMKTGDVSGIIETSTDFVIVRVNGSQPKALIPYAQVKDSLRKDFQQATLTNRRKQLSEQLKKAFKVEVL